ncbi:VOC family protein [Aurantiacibacter suaedae]|uniref:VOC family protein n=1 Tax=Aurantiacibacter suaedae TaxID=2545755 RepID=UPI0010F531BA|nr:VOC family protein [Aurantiacibacter suaedae]
MRTILLGVATLALAASCAAAQDAGVVTTPEGAVLDTDPDLAYKPGELTEAQLEADNSALFTAEGMNVFRRFPRDLTQQMVAFYTQALALRSLSPIQLTSTQQMILTGVGSMQIKLSAGQQGDRLYNLEGGYRGGTGIRFLMLHYPDADVVRERFVEAGFDAPEFVQRADGAKQALVSDPAGLDIILIATPDAQDNADDGVNVGIQVSNLAESRAFYRDFVGLEELPKMDAPLLGTEFYPYALGETTLLLYKLGEDLPADSGSSGIQYVVSDAALVDARGKHRGITVETPLNRLTGFGLTTVWLNDPDGVTNYFAQTSAATPPATPAD